MEVTKIVEVTHADIRNGWRGSECYCPLAKAIQRAFPGSRVWIDSWSIDVVGTGFDYVFKPSDELLDWMEDFDSNKEMSPFSFTLIGSNREKCST